MEMTGQWEQILPVFAGMIPDLAQAGNTRRDSPRIRGDDP